MVPLTTALGVIEWLDDTQTMKTTLEQIKVPKLERIVLNFLNGMRTHRLTGKFSTNSWAAFRQGR